jgi:hypothetical protein
MRDVERHQNSPFTGRIGKLCFIRLAEPVGFRCAGRVGSLFSQSGRDRCVYVFVGEESRGAHGPDLPAEC